MTTGTFYLLWGGYRGKKKLLSAFKTLRKGSPLQSQTRKEQKIRPLALKYGLCTIKTIKPKHFYSPMNSHSRLATQPTSKPNREVRGKIQQHRTWKPLIMSENATEATERNSCRHTSDSRRTQLMQTPHHTTQCHRRQNVNMPGNTGAFFQWGSHKCMPHQAATGGSLHTPKAREESLERTVVYEAWVNKHCHGKLQLMSLPPVTQWPYVRHCFSSLTRPQGLKTTFKNLTSN